MENLPDDHPGWMQIADPDDLSEVPLYLPGDPYFPRDTPTNHLDEEDPSEDEEEDDLESDEESGDEDIF